MSQQAKKYIYRQSQPIVGGTIPRQMDLGGIRKVTEYVTGSKPVSSILS